MTKQRTILTEDFVQNAVVKYLAKNGWGKSLKSANLWEQGVDIRVRNNKFTRYWLIEVKGDPSNKVKSPAGSRSSSFNSAVGQIITRMHTKRKRAYKYGYKYGIAFPKSFRKMVIKKMPYDVLDKLNLYIFFVDKSGGVEEIDWRELRKIQEEVYNF
jgi:hypothetical protein